MPVTQDKSGPYAPASAILAIIDRHRTKGLPSPVDAETLVRSGISESLIPRTLQALATLDLIDEVGNPTDTLEGLRLSPEPEFKDRMADWLRSAYTDALQFVEPDAKETAIRDAFRSYNPIGQQDRMVSLFTGLMIEAGLREKPEKKQSPRSQDGGSKPRKRPTRKPPQGADASRKSKENFSAGNTNTVISRMPPAISGLLQSLPSINEGWSQEKRDQFLKTFGTVLDFCIPINKDGIDGKNKEELEEEYDET